MNGTTIHYEELGEGVLLVLLHGGLSSSAAWEPLIPELVDGFRVISPDNRGHGHATNPAGQLSYPLIADTAALIAALGLTHTVVGGWSDGGQATLELAVRHPGVAGALIVGAAYPDFARTGLRDAHRALLCADTAGIPDLERLDDHEHLIKSRHPGPRQWRRLIQQTAPMWLDYAGLTPYELRAIETRPSCSRVTGTSSSRSTCRSRSTERCPMPSSPSARPPITAGR